MYRRKQIEFGPVYFSWAVGYGEWEIIIGLGTPAFRHAVAVAFSGPQFKVQGWSF